MISDSEAPKKLSPVEGIKTDSDYLRGSILEELADASTGSVSEETYQTLKFHGTYLQDDRDLRSERRKQKLEKAFQFMLRVRVPGGVATPEQWLAIDELAGKHGRGDFKLTTRQAFQIHGILKGDLKPTIAEVNKACMDTLAACGDVNRNVMCNVNPEQSEAHASVCADAREISDRLSPQTRAYYEIWLDEERVAGGEEEIEPIYGKTYLPRKFKVGFAVPPSNDVDIYTQDLGFTAIVEGGEVVGYNVTAGGGMGMSHKMPETFPRLADTIGYVSREKLFSVAEAVVTTQRDFGDRENRKHARLKYTIQDRGVEWFRAEVERRMGFAFEPARDVEFDSRRDAYGWRDSINGRQSLTLYIEQGRVEDGERVKMRSGLREVAKIHDGDFRLTPNQHLVIAEVSQEKRPQIEAILEEHGIQEAQKISGLRRNSSACVALPTCGLALAESERYLPGLVDKIEAFAREAGIEDEDIVIRMTGCPNGCARPYNAEIAFVGRAPGKYNMYLGGAFDGSRLARLYKEALKEEQILEEAEALIKAFAKDRREGERFGDYCVRAGVVAEVKGCEDFHA